MSQKSKSKKSPAGPADRSEFRGGVPAAASSGGGSGGLVNDVEPVADSASVPAWMYILAIVMVYWAMLHLDQFAGGFNAQVFGPYRSYKQIADLQPKSGTAMLIARGESLFSTYCVACHGAAGLGTPGTYPPLEGSEWVQGTPARLIRIPNNGLQGPITVKGQPWNSSMTAIGGTLSDEELAAILSFVRKQFGNNSPPITPQRVRAVRAEIGARPRDGSAPWSSDELLKVPETP